MPTAGRLRGVWVVALAVAAGPAACTSDWNALRDAARDAEVPDAPRDAPNDVPMDAPADAPVDALVDAPVDAPPSPRCHPMIDGTIGADWDPEALVAQNTVATEWGVGLNELRAVRVCYDDTTLYLGIEGAAEAANAMVLFLDRDDGAGTGVTTGAALLDHAGALDGAISSRFGSFPAGFGADLVWGTRGMLTHRGAVAPDVGLREVRTNPSDYGWIPGDETVCSAANGACEVSLPWTALYGGPRPATARVALFVRLGNGDGSMASNQTLPQDEPANPFAVTRVLRFTAGP